VVDCARTVVPRVFDEVSALEDLCRLKEGDGRTYDYHMTEATEHDGDVKSVEMGDVATESTDSDLEGAESVPSAVEVAEAWLAELVDQMAVSASDVQDHLLDLWGVLEEGPARSEIERWLTETLVRNLYSVSDINVRLETLLPAS
jgi:hypothetical protein